jgi:hypothetical protein
MKTETASPASQLHTANPGEKALYCGLNVRIVTRLEFCSVIEYEGRPFLVESADLRRAEAMKCAA